MFSYIFWSKEKENKPRTDVFMIQTAVTAVLPEIRLKTCVFFFSNIKQTSLLFLFLFFWQLQHNQPAACLIKFHRVRTDLTSIQNVKSQSEILFTFHFVLKMRVKLF